MQNYKNGRTILVGEDEVEVRSYLEMALKYLGYSVELAEDGDEVISCLESSRAEIAAVLLDMRTFCGIRGSRSWCVYGVLSGGLELEGETSRSCSVVKSRSARSTARRLLVSVRPRHPLLVTRAREVALGAWTVAPSKERVALPPDDDTGAGGPSASTTACRSRVVKARASRQHSPGSWDTVEDDSRLRTVATCVAC